MKAVGRSLANSEWIELDVQHGLIQRVSPASGPTTPGPDDEWLAPAFWDIQVNGRLGHSFSSPDLTVEQTVDVILAQAALGTARVCPTLITAPAADMIHGVRTIAAACDRDPRIASRVAGIHLEGPFLSDVDGYRGAHPAAAIRDPDWSLFEQLQAASGGRVVQTLGVRASRCDRMDSPRHGGRHRDRPGPHGRRADREIQAAVAAGSTG